MSPDDEVIVYTVIIHKCCYSVKSLRIFYKCYLSSSDFKTSAIIF